MKHLFTIALALAVSGAHADEWTGSDKTLHFVGGAVIAAAVTASTGNEWAGFATGTTAGLIKEVYDSTGRGHASGKDFVVTAFGALLGAKFTGWTLTPNGLTYSRRINIF